MSYCSINHYLYIIMFYQICITHSSEILSVSLIWYSVLLPSLASSLLSPSLFSFLPSSPPSTSLPQRHKKDIINRWERKTGALTIHKIQSQHQVKYYYNYIPTITISKFLPEHVTAYYNILSQLHTYFLRKFHHLNLELISKSQGNNKSDSIYKVLSTMLGQNKYLMNITYLQ